MMNIKAQITMELPGSTMLSEEEAMEEKAFDSFQMEVQDHLGKETVLVKTRRCRPALKILNITEEAYAFYTSVEPLSKNVNLQQWRNMSRTERFQHAVAFLVKDLGGINYSVKIFGE